MLAKTDIINLKVSIDLKVVESKKISKNIKLKYKYKKKNLFILFLKIIK